MLCSFLLCLHLASFAFVCRLLRVFPSLSLRDCYILWSSIHFYKVMSSVADSHCSLLIHLYLASFAVICRLLHVFPSAACTAASVSTTCCLLLWPGSFCSHLFRFFHCQFGFSSLLPLESIYPRACECEAALHRYGEVKWAK